MGGRLTAGAARDDLARGVGKLLARHEPVDEPELARFDGTQRLAGQHEVKGGGCADEPRRTHGSSESRVDAEHDFGKPEAEPAIVRADAVIAGERKLQTAA